MQVTSQRSVSAPSLLPVQTKDRAASGDRVELGVAEAPGLVSRAQFHTWMQQMPKVELHTHVEGAVRPETVLDIAGQYDLPLPASTVSALKEKIGMRPGEDLLAFLKKFDHFRFVFDRPETLSRLAYELVEDNAQEKVGYTELRINPLKNRDKVGIGEVLDATLSGMDRACLEHGVKARLIASINRSYPVESAMEVAQAAVARKDRGIVGLDLAGDEVHHPASKFKEVFDYARANGLHVTIHAGEAMGPESIRQAIDDCGAERIGHGVRLGEDPALLRRVRDEGVVLEMCPTSNALLNVTPDLAAYPLQRYHHQGVKTTINTDDRHIFGITLSGEYTTLAEKTGMTLGELQQVAANGVEAAFLPPRDKAELRREFQEQMGRFSAGLPGRNYLIRPQAD